MKTRYANYVAALLALLLLLTSCASGGNATAEEKASSDTGAVRLTETANLMETLQQVEAAFQDNSASTLFDADSGLLRAERSENGVRVSAHWGEAAWTAYFAVYAESGQMLGAAVAPDGVTEWATEIVCDANQASAAKMFRLDTESRPVLPAISAPVESREAEIALTVAGRVLNVEWADNSTVDALRELLKKGDVTLDMSDYAGFEKGAPLPETLPQNNEPMNTDAGDIILYQGRQFVIYYDKNNWSLTPLGKITGMTKAELQALLGAGNVAATLSLVAKTSGRESTVGEFDFATKTVRLNSGYDMPILGLGTWTLNDEQAENSVYHALKDGYRLIDTARYYGNEVGVGRGIRKAIGEGLVKREEIFVTSKIMPGDYNRAAQGIDASLRDLGLDYLDLMLIHQPGSNDRAVYQAMEQGVRDGKIRSIGISNYYTKQSFDKVLSYAEIIPAVVQNENHLYYQNNELRDYARQYGTIVESWYPFGGRGHTQEHFENPTITKIAQMHGKSSAQTILRWQLQAGYVAIPGSKNPEHIAENYRIFDFALSDAEMDLIASLNQNRRYESW